jgi:GT2 family glycosyltransferase
MDDAHLVTVVIPHFNGLDILRDCLDSLYKNRFRPYRTVIVDNGSSDGSPQMIRNEYPWAELICNSENLGYAGACNQGIALAQSEFILLLNNDTVMPENFLEEMCAALINDREAAMVQPKILSIQDKRYFDYSGGCGGEMDIFGYPFARGRIFDTVEEDTGQYEGLTNQVFWTSGCALLLRKSVADEIGALDHDFFAHQEEIDLNWRAQLAGYHNLVTTRTYIYHYSGYTLRSDNQRKMYYNHRNNLILMLKNYSLPLLFILFPVRIMFELATVAADAVFWEGKRARAVVRALLYILFHPIGIFRKNRQVQRLRKVPDRIILKNMYRRSLVFDHFLRRMTPLMCVRMFRKDNGTK